MGGDDYENHEEGIIHHADPVEEEEDEPALIHHADLEEEKEPTAARSMLNENGEMVELWRFEGEESGSC